VCCIDRAYGCNVGSQTLDERCFVCQDVQAWRLSKGDRRISCGDTTMILPGTLVSFTNPFADVFDVHQRKQDRPTFKQPTGMFHFINDYASKEAALKARRSIQAAKPEKTYLVISASKNRALIMQSQDGKFYVAMVADLGRVDDFKDMF